MAIIKDGVKTFEGAVIKLREHCLYYSWNENIVKINQENYWQIEKVVVYCNHSKWVTIIQEVKANEKS